MDFFEFLERPLPAAFTVGFFSEDALLRSCVYRKLRRAAESQGGEFQFHRVEDGGWKTLNTQLNQGGLFTQRRVHGLFFGPEHFSTVAKRQRLKDLHSGPDLVMWVGACAFNKLWVKSLPPGMEVIPSPVIQTPADLKRLTACLTDFLPYWVTGSAWESTWKRTSGGISESFYEALKQTMLADVTSAADPEPTHPSKNDLFNFIKKLSQARSSLAEIIGESATHLSETAEWYPFLGLLYQQAAQVSGRPPRKAWETLAQVDHWVKHFVPTAEVGQITPFAIALLHKAFQLGSIRV